MTENRLLVVGAAGDVGQGIVEAALASGRKVVAAGRSADKLDLLAARLDNPDLACVTGDLADEVRAKALWDAACACFGTPGEVVVSVNTPNRIRGLMEWSAGELGEVLGGNVLTHFVAAKTYLPLMPENGRLLGVGGGTADFIFPKMAHVSMGQAALRMMYRGLAKEVRSGARAQELLIVSMVAGESNREAAPADWITAEEVGRHVCAIFDAPEDFAKPVLHLRSRDQVGQPEEDRS